MPGCAQEHKAHGPQWVELIGVANKNAAFATLIGLAKQFEAHGASFFDDFDGFAFFMSGSISRSGDFCAQMDGHNRLLYPLLMCAGY